jgi:hypothetical protein
MSSGTEFDAKEGHHAESNVGLAHQIVTALFAITRVHADQERQLLNLLSSAKISALDDTTRKAVRQCIVRLDDLEQVLVALPQSLLSARRKFGRRAQRLAEERAKEEVAEEGARALRRVFHDGQLCLMVFVQTIGDLRQVLEVPIVPARI